MAAQTKSKRHDVDTSNLKPKEAAATSQTTPRTWWQWVLVYPTLAVTLIGSIPAAKELILSTRAGLLFGQSCKTIEAAATTNGVRFPGYMSGQSVIGKGRLQFYSAPDRKCDLNGVFILPDESVQASMDYKGYTFVMYMKPRTGTGASGWVESARLKPNETSIAPRQ